MDIQKIIISTLQMIVTGILVQKVDKKTGKKKWALVTRKPDKRTGKRRVLYWFGSKKPSEESVSKQEKRVQYFKHKG